MKKKKMLWVSFIVLSLFFILGGCKQETVKKEAEPVDWPFYTIQKGEKESGHLLGSIHIGKSEMYPFPDKITSALKESDTVISEVPFAQLYGKATQELAQEAMKADPDVLSGLSEDQLKELNTKLESYNITTDELKGMSMLGLQTILQQGYTSTAAALNGVDYKISLKMDKKQQNIGLESAREQFTMLGGYYDKMREKENWIQEIPSLEAAKKETDELLNSYIKGTLENNFSTLQSDDPEFTDELLDLRNKNWNAPLLEELGSGKTNFIVVGAGHLYGETGILKQLEEAGYTVTKVKF